MKRDIFQKDKIVWLGDICFFQDEISMKRINRLLVRFTNKNPNWSLNTFGKVISPQYLLYYKIRNEYTISMLNETIPAWFYDIPKYVQYQIRVEYVRGEGTDPFRIYRIPLTKLGCVIVDNGLVNDFFDGFKMHRLFQVRQLGFIHDPIHRVNDSTTTVMDFQHMRGLHHLDVYAIMSLIVENNPCLHPYRNTLLVAAVTHDGKTPAGGDTTKLIDLDLFNEDKNYREYFTTPEWTPLAHKYNLDQDILYSVVLGEGLLGTVLDIADKIAYIARDAWTFLEFYGDPDGVQSPLFMEGQRLIREDPYICDVWKYVRVVKDRVVVTNGEKLARFLKLRAIMFKELYYKRESRFLEYMLSKKVIKYLFENRDITFEELLSHNDSWLEAKINEFFGIEFFPLSFESSKIYIFDTEEKARDCFHILSEDENFLPIFDDFQKVTTDAVKRFSVKKGGKVVPFSEVYPDKAREIGDIMTFPKEYGVYAISLRDLRVPRSNYKKIQKIKKAIR